MGEYPFLVIGGKDVGLKVSDLEKHRNALESAGFTVLQGPVVAVEVFDNFCNENGLNEDTECERRVFDLSMSSGIYQANKQLLRLLEVGKAYAIRSSAHSDRGGNGIFETTFFVPSGDKGQDMKELWFFEREVYASEFSDRAKAWRNKHGGKMGMALWITPVVGSEVPDGADGKTFYPCMNGQAYTGYHGKPLVRLVAGLAYKEAGEELVDFTECPDSMEFRRIIEHQQMLRQVHLTGRMCAAYPLDYSKTAALANLPEEFPDHLFSKLERMKDNGDFYLEWAIASPFTKEIVVTQCASWEDKPMELVAPDLVGLKLIASGSDIINHGKTTAKCLVYVSKQYWFRYGVAEVEEINEGLSNFILVVPEPAFSSQADNAYRLGGTIRLAGMGSNLLRDISYEHFSNACGLIESQEKPVGLSSGPLAEFEKMNRLLVGIPVSDHASYKRGGQHFQQLCDREDILFLGTEFDPRPLEREADPYVYGEGIKIWEGEFVLVNDIPGENGVLYFREGSIQSIKSEYSVHWLDGISMKLRRLAGEETDPEISGMLYSIHHLIPGDSTTILPDPFYIDPATVVENGGKEKTAEYLHRFISEGAEILSDGWSPKLERYFRELLVHLKEWDPNN